jgi:acyl-CoA reductase-like NAD-dependent aldehyde dehydrogenase
MPNFLYEMSTRQALNLIDGVWKKSISGEFHPRTNPCNGELLGEMAVSGKNDAELAVSAALAAFENPLWSQNPRLRQMVLLRWADNLEKQIEPIATLLTHENGKVIAQSRGEIIAAISEIRYYAGLTRYMPGHVYEVEPGVFSTILKEPAGVAGIIVPWNAPAVLLIRSLAPALAAGCTAVVKPATQTSLVTAAMIQELNNVEGCIPGVINLINEVGSEVASYLTTSDNVAVLSFTGSNAVGQKIMAAAAPSMKKLSLELGGKSACIVFPDVEILETAKMLANAATIISGQQCTAARRVLVQDSCFDEMKVALTQALKNIKVGQGLGQGVQMGPMIDMAAAVSVGGMIESAMDLADEVLLRGTTKPKSISDGAFLTPSLIAHSDTKANFIQEEIFGPLLVIERFSGEMEAIEKANDSVYGLSASVWTRDGARGIRMARALKSGTVWINDHNKLFAEAETGGYRKSGLGRLHGYEGLVDFQEIKHIYQNVGIIQKM